MAEMHAARLAMLEAAVCALLREASTSGDEDAPDGVSVTAYADHGLTVIDVSYTLRGVPVAGESL